jgi:hypothetical protein
MKDRRSDPDPTLVQILISVGTGSVIVASSIACFILAVRLLKRIFHLGDNVALAMTTNQIFIWLRSNAPPKIIPPGYELPLWGD